MSAHDDTTRDRPVAGDTLPGAAARPTPPGVEVAPGVALDPETRQPMAIPAGADAPPTAPAEMLGSFGDGDLNLARPDDLREGPPS